MVSLEKEQGKREDASEMLNELATIIALVTWNDVMKEIKYEDTIEDFISKNTKQMMLFNRS